jgi:hypothetical protein
VSATQKACSIKGTKKLLRSGHTLQAALELIACWMRQRFLVIEHRAEIAHVKPAFKEVKLNRGRRWPRQVSILMLARIRLTKR